MPVLCDTVSWLTGSELRSFGDSEIYSYFPLSHLISNHSLEKATKDIFDESYEAKAVCQRMKAENLLKSVLSLQKRFTL
jgi:hypothetical protein